jgi:hypothetical protein
MPRQIMSYLVPKIEPILILVLIFEQGCHWQDGDVHWAVVAWQEGFLGGSGGRMLQIAIA